MLKVIVSFLLLFSFTLNALAVPEGLVHPSDETSHENCCCVHSEICQCVHAGQKVFGELSKTEKETVSLKASGCGLSDEAVKILLSSRDYYFYDVNGAFFIPQLNNKFVSAFYFSFPILDLSIELPPKLA